MRHLLLKLELAAIGALVLIAAGQQLLQLGRWIVALHIRFT